jgi:hypothetical protein
MRFRYCSPIKYEEQIERNIIDKAKSILIAMKLHHLEISIVEYKLGMNKIK